MTMTRQCPLRWRPVLITLVLVGLTAVCSAATITLRPGVYPAIQDAIAAAHPGDEIVLAPGIYPGCSNYMGKAVTVRSTNPDDPAVVAATVVWDLQCFGFFDGEGRGSVLAGVTLYGMEDCVGIVISGASPTIRNCVFDGAETGIRIYCGDPLIQNCTFSGILYKAIEVYHGAPLIDACTIRDGACAIYCAGGDGLPDASPTLSRCTIVNNHGSNGAAGVIFGGHLTISDSLITNNRIPGSPTGLASAFDLYGGSVTIEGCTIIGNSGGFARIPDAQAFRPHGPFVLRNTILWGNPGGPLLPDPGASVAPVEVSYSIVEGGYARTGVLNVDPMLLPNGRLSPNSPCINAGDPAFAPAPGELDLDGQPRVIGSFVDIGADEFAQPGDVNADGGVDVIDLLYMVDCWGLSLSEPGYDARCDFDGDGSVDVVDLLILVENWDQG